MNALFPDLHVVSLGKDLVADGTAEVTSAVVDMAGFDEVTFLVKLGDVDAAAVLTLAVKENTADSVSSPTPTAITGASVVLTEDAGNLDDKIVMITVARSKIGKRYVFLSITATVESFEIDSIITIKGMPRTAPVTQPSDVVSTVKVAA